MGYFKNSSRDINTSEAGSIFGELQVLLLTFRKPKGSSGEPGQSHHFTRLVGSRISSEGVVFNLPGQSLVRQRDSCLCCEATAVSASIREFVL